MTFYRSNTFNQTFYVDASASSGYKNNIVQTGNIQNQGIELALGYSDTFDKVKVSTNFTYTLNQNKIVSLAMVPSIRKPAKLSKWSITQKEHWELVVVRL
jgi:hypothetical protein